MEGQAGQLWAFVREDKDPAWEGERWHAGMVPVNAWEQRPGNVCVAPPVKGPGKEAAGAPCCGGDLKDPVPLEGESSPGFDHRFTCESCGAAWGVDTLNVKDLVPWEGETPEKVSHGEVDQGGSLVWTELRDPL